MKKQTAKQISIQTAEGASAPSAVYSARRVGLPRKANEEVAFTHQPWPTDPIYFLLFAYNEAGMLPAATRSRNNRTVHSNKQTR